MATTKTALKRTPKPRTDEQRANEREAARQRRAEAKRALKEFTPKRKSQARPDFSAEAAVRSAREAFHGPQPPSNDVVTDAKRELEFERGLDAFMRRERRKAAWAFAGALLVAAFIGASVTLNVALLVLR